LDFIFSTEGKSVSSASMKRLRCFMLILLTAFVASTMRAEIIDTDVCVFGGTSGGIAAAVQVSRMGKRVVIAEPGKYLGGLTTGGLGATDIGNKAAVGGLAWDFYHRIAKHYAQDSAWKYETRAEYFARRGSGQSKASDLTSSNAAMWTFEPHVADKVYNDWLREAKVPAYFEQRLVSVKKDGTRITEFTVENGNVYRAKMFIDATYEGDLMAKAGVSFHVGREANTTYGETLNGIRAETPKHQFTVPVDPYVKPGDAKSGLLPFVQADVLGGAGEGDHRVQAYNYRLCFTTNDANRLPVEKPRGYDEKRYELLARYLEALVAAGKKPKLAEFWNPIWMPNHKTDINNNGGFSTDFIGANYEYPGADYKARARMEREHEDYIRGFITFLATSPRVPENIRKEMQRWGPAKDEFLPTDGWPRQLYVREARRLIGELVMTEQHCRGKEKVNDPIGLAAYNMDSHNCTRVVRNGRAENEGDVQVPPMSPYGISYRSLIPKATECANLFVPVAMSSSHIAYGSIRMEPVFMILGQSAATAACQAMEEGVTVQAVNYSKLRARLLADGQILEWTGGATAGRVGLINPRSLKGIVLDDAHGEKSGGWLESGNAGACLAGTGYFHDGDAHKGEVSITWRPEITEAGEYEIFILAPPHGNRATNVPVTISIGTAKPVTLKINQRDAQSKGVVSVGRFKLPQGRGTTVTLSNAGTDGHVIADGVQIIRTGMP
jgi:FAD dependent oxidoreductase